MIFKISTATILNK